MSGLLCSQCGRMCWRVLTGGFACVRRRGLDWGAGVEMEEDARV